MLPPDAALLLGRLAAHLGVEPAVAAYQAIALLDTTLAASRLHREVAALRTDPDRWAAYQARRAEEELADLTPSASSGGPLSLGVARMDLFRQEDPEEWSSLGQSLMNLGRYEEALAAFDRALALRPDDSDVWHARGAALTNLKRLEEAQAAFDQEWLLRSRYSETEPPLSGSHRFTAEPSGREAE